MTATNTPDERRLLRTFGRTGGRALSARQQGLIDTLLPHLTVPVDGTADGELARVDLFEDKCELWLEIGFGGAEHLLGQAARHPDIGFIGCEPFIEGMAKALTGIESDNISNIRLWMDDARVMMAKLADHSVDRLFIMFPDPWPKKKHQKRRLIQPEFLTEVRRIMKRGGRLRFATDVMSYADEALWRFINHGGYNWQAADANDWRNPPADHIQTRYEAKQLGDCQPVFYDFVIE